METLELGKKSVKRTPAPKAAKAPLAIETGDQASAKPKRAAKPKLALKPAADRHERVAVAAYYLSEKRHFEPGGELDDWFAAENMIDAADQRDAKG